MQSDRHQHSLLRQDGYRRIEMITGQRRRRQWSDEEKARIVLESFAPGRKYLRCGAAAWRELRLAA